MLVIFISAPLSSTVLHCRRDLGNNDPSASGSAQLCTSTPCTVSSSRADRAVCGVSVQALIKTIEMLASVRRGCAEA